MDRGIEPGGDESRSVMAGLVPAIPSFASWFSKDVDARHGAGHDGVLFEHAEGVVVGTLRFAHAR
jgi:hypothetical protein